MSLIFFYCHFVNSKGPKKNVNKEDVTKLMGVLNDIVQSGGKNNSEFLTIIKDNNNNDLSNII